MFPKLNPVFCSNIISCFVHDIKNISSGLGIGTLFSKIFFQYGKSQYSPLNHSSWSIYFSSVQSLIYVWLLQPHGLQHARPPCPSPTPRVYSNSCPLNWWCHPAISSSVVPFPIHLMPFKILKFLPATKWFPLKKTWFQLFTSIMYCSLMI